MKHKFKFYTKMYVKTKIYIISDHKRETNLVKKTT